MTETDILSTVATDETWRQDAAQLHAQFVIDFVEGLDFCPWARSARIAGRTKVVALRWREVDAFIRCELPRDLYAKMEVWQLVVPDATDHAMQWRREVAELEQQLRREGVPLPWALAAFHPTHPGRPETSGGTIGMLRRSPMPAIQLVRLDVLDRVRARASAQVEQLGAHNQEQLLSWLQQPAQQERHAAWLQEGQRITQALAALEST